jgi:hypothetical protein
MDAIDAENRRQAPGRFDFDCHSAWSISSVTETISMQRAVVPRWFLSGSA